MFNYVLCQRVCRVNPAWIHTLAHSGAVHETQKPTSTNLVLRWDGDERRLNSRAQKERGKKWCLCEAKQCDRVRWRERERRTSMSSEWFRSAKGRKGLKRNWAGLLGGSGAAEHGSVRAKASHFPKHCRHSARGTAKPLETKMACRS